MENCAKALADVLARVDDGDTVDEAAAGVIDEYKATRRRIAGFGHRVHTADPRTARLFELAREAGAFGRNCEAATAVEKVFADRGKALPINVDGAIGAILADLKFEPDMSRWFPVWGAPGL